MSPSMLAPLVFSELVYAYCLTFSASETSGVRTVQHNAAVGGHPKSAHLAGLARDVVYDGGRPGVEADAWLQLRGLRRLWEGDHDHVMPLDWNP